MSAALNALIRSIVAEHPEVHAHKIAGMVAEVTPAEKVHEFYSAALEPLVSDLIRSARNTTMNSPKGHSPKREERRTWWAQVLAERVHVGGSKYLTIGECGLAELEYCISERNEKIGALLGQIEKFRKIRDAVVAQGVSTVAELPEPVQL